MSIQIATIDYSGLGALLINNPQMSDPLNSYTKLMKIPGKKRVKTDEDYLLMRDIEMRAKIYWDEDLKIYVPSSWVAASIAQIAFKLEKISKADVRGSVFVTEPKLKLQYRDIDKVKSPEDIVKNPDFVLVKSIKQGQVRVTKAAPIFHKWSFQAVVEFDNSMIEPVALERIIRHGAKYMGFGDFRPTYGRATAEVEFD